MFLPGTIVDAGNTKLFSLEQIMVNTKLPYSVIINCQVKAEYRMSWKPDDGTRTEGEISGMSQKLWKRVHCRVES